MGDFDAALRAFEEELRATEEALLRGLERGAEMLTDAGQATTNYRNQTWATRSGTIAYVSTADDDGSAAFSKALDAVEDRNEGHGLSARGPAPSANAPRIIFTVPTDYIDDLEDRGHGFLEAVHAASGPAIHAAIEEEIRAAQR